MKQKIVKETLNYALIAVMAAVQAAVYHIFVFENDFAPAGVGGIVTMVQYAFSFDAGYLNLIINVPLALAVFFFADRTYALRSFLFVLVFSGMLFVWDAAGLYRYDAGESRILAVIAAGAVIGIVYGFSLRINSSTGGTDFIAALVHKAKPQLSLVWVIFALNASVAVVSFFVYGQQMEPVILCLAYCFIQSRISDGILKGFSSALKAEIVTDKPEELTERLLSGTHHGVTEISVRGGYSHAEKTMIVCLINKRDLVTFKKILSEFENTFAYVSSVNDVYGRFFRNNVL
ncbi:MAG: hypothetical protein DBX59_02775 [Bacillota bacterium]|nr:MAG: hypothetical protein DBX59_02775 [Bacillota bacterium]